MLVLIHQILKYKLMFYEIYIYIYIYILHGISKGATGLFTKVYLVEVQGWMYRAPSKIKLQLILNSTAAIHMYFLKIHVNN